MRFHVLGLPHTVSNKEYVACAYTQKVVKFCKMMKGYGHHIIHYGHEDSDTLADEQVSVVGNKDLEIAYGSYDWRKNFFKFDMNDHAYQTFFRNTIYEISKRKQPNDFILPFWGGGVRPICDAHQDLICVEPGIGYAGGHWAKWKVFESYAIYHAYCGLNNVGTCNQGWYDVVIPNYFDLNEFEFSREKDDYFLFLGRVYDGKGVNIAIQASELAGVKLIIAGQKEESYPLPKHVEYIGYADVETRKRLMSRAKASFLPSMYVEPFGGVQIENLLCGTPTITTDWGAFAENNIHGITGYRCRTMGDFINAIESIDSIKPADCRSWGENFSLERVAPMYNKFFNDVLNVYTGDGWYTRTPKETLSANTKIFNFTQNNNWWAENLDGRITMENGEPLTTESFKSWMGGPLDEDRKMVRSLIMNEFPLDHKVSVLDVGCGACPEYIGLDATYSGRFTYLGIDITLDLVAQALKNGIQAKLGHIENLDMEDNSYDFVNCRHILEHLSNFKHAIKELCRVSKHYVAISFFIQPNDSESNIIDYNPYGSGSINIYNNSYSRSLINDYINQLPDIADYEWIKAPAETKSTDILIIKKKVHKPKVAIWSEDGWALGRIHSAVIKYLSHKFDFTMYDWSNREKSASLWGGGWKDYDVLLGNSGIAYYAQELGYLTEEPTQEMLDKMVAVLHSPIINHNFYNEKVSAKGPLYCGITKEVAENKNLEDIVDIGVDLDLFFPTRKIEKIKTIGFIGQPNPSTDDIKRPQMFIDIAEKAGLDYKFIYGKDYRLYHKLYEDIDMLVYCSTQEGVATGIAEAAACKIPVLSTRVGYAKDLKRIFTFGTVDSAVYLINYLNGNPNRISEYVDRLYKEVAEKYDWKKVIGSWERVLMKRINNG